MNKFEWIDTEVELPSSDGSYEITNTPAYESDGDWTQRYPISTAYYDGWGFSCNGVYKQPRYWRKHELAEKRYGKVSQ